MSWYTRHRRREQERAGGSYLLDPSRRLPRAQERVQQDRSRADYERLQDALGPFAAGIPTSEFRVVPERSGGRRSSFYGGSRVTFAPRPVQAYGWSELKKLYMQAPSRVKFCVARKERKEVLFALGRAGFSGSGRGTRRSDGRLYRRSASSQYRC